MAINTPLEVPDPEYARVIEMIDDLAKLPAGWNSHRADPINQHARDRAKRFVLSFLSHYRRVPPPRVAPTPSGGVLLHWDAGSLEVEIVINPVGGTYSVAEVGSPEFLVYGDDLGSIDPRKEILDSYLFR